MRIGTVLYRVPDSIGFLVGSDHWLDAGTLIGEVGRLAGAGFRHVELSADLSILGPRLFTARTIARLRALADERDLTYSVHLHGTCSSRFGRYGICLDSLDERVRRATVQTLKAAVRRLLPLGVQYFVLHVGWGEGQVRHLAASHALTDAGKSHLIGRFMQQAERSLAELVTAAPARWFCLENLPTDFEPAYRLAEQFDTSVCFDGGHWVLQGRELPEFVARYGPRIAMVHSHGVADGTDHQPLTAAQAPAWRDLLQWLAAQGFSGPVVLQVTEEEGALTSSRLLQQFLAAQGEPT